MNNTLTIDLETTIRSQIGMKASPYWPDNKMVIGGCKYSEGQVVFFDDKYFDVPIKPELIIGQNFKFDITYIHRDNLALYKTLINIDWWDTSVAEYILTAQQHKYPSLNEMSEKYGLPSKPDKIKEYWDKGIDTTDIPEEELKEYLIHDVTTTETIAHKQILLARERDQYDLIIHHSNVAKALAEMEYNGLQVEQDRMETARVKLQEEKEELEQDLLYDLYTTYSYIPSDIWNLQSDKQLSSIIFGGYIEWSFLEEVGTKAVTRVVGKEPIGVYKSGKRKGETRYKNIKEEVEVPDKERIEGSAHINLLGINPKKEWANANGYSTSDEILKELLKHYQGLKQQPTKKIRWIESILRLRYLNKMISTYCVGLAKMIFPDGKIHHSLNNTATDTARLSSTKPNAQNIPSGKNDPVKSFFVSRFGNKGSIVQVDYSQLEVVWQAFVTGDKNLKQGIIEGIDFHCKRLAKKEGKSYEEIYDLCKVKEDPEWSGKRRDIKVFTFQRAYGAGAAAISKSTGMDIKTVKNLIQNEVEMYPDVEGHFDKVKALSERNSKDGVGYYKSITGRAYHYKYYDNYDGKSMSPTQLRNYDIQGGATGDLVPIYILDLFKRLTSSPVCDKVFLINTVHDSVILDVHNDVLDLVCKGLKKYLEDVSTLKSYLGLDFDIPLKVDVEAGSDWGSLKTIKL